MITLISKFLTDGFLPRCGTDDWIEFERKTRKEQEFIVNELEELISKSESLLSVISCYLSEKEDVNNLKHTEYYYLLDNQYNSIYSNIELYKHTLNITKRVLSEELHHI